jgi:hypothetical protein
MSNPESTVPAGTATDELVAGIRADARRFVIHLHIAVAIQTVGYCVGLYVLATNLC